MDVLAVFIQSIGIFWFLIPIFILVAVAKTS